MAVFLNFENSCAALGHLYGTGAELLGLLPEYVEYRWRADIKPTQQHFVREGGGEKELRGVLVGESPALEFFRQKVVPVLDRYQSDKKLLEFFNFQNSEF